MRRDRDKRREEKRRESFRRRSLSPAAVKMLRDIALRGGLRRKGKRGCGAGPGSRHGMLDSRLCSCNEWAGLISWGFSSAIREAETREAGTQAINKTARSSASVRELKIFTTSCHRRPRGTTGRARKRGFHK